MGGVLGQPLHLVHRDVSPSNIMIGVGGVAKLLDFGVAKALAPEPEGHNPATETGVLKGKLWYMAPERMAGERFDQRADLFSAGVVLHESLTGWRLFNGNSVSEIASMMRRGVAPPSALNPEVPPALDAICMRALATDPSQRFASGREMAAALDAVLFELKWGASELAALLRQLFPPGDAAAHDELALASTQLAEDRRRPEPDLHVAPTAAMAPRRPAGPPVSDERTALLPHRQQHETVKVDDEQMHELDHMQLLEHADTRPMSAPPLRLQDHEDISPEPWARTTPGTPTALAAEPLQQRRSGTITVPTQSTPMLAPHVPNVDESSVLLSTGGRLASGSWPPTEQGPTILLDRHGEPTRAPRRSSSRARARRAYVAAVAVALVGAGALFALRLALDETVKVQIESEPPGARFVIGGNPPAEGRTPSRVELPKSSARRHVVVTLPGYKPADRVIMLDSDRTEAIVLEPETKP
jgi:serine/threonine protein kinase